MPPANQRALLEEVHAALRAGQFSVGEGLLRKAIHLRPDSPEAWNLLGICAMQTGRPAEAVKHFRVAVGLRDQFPEATANLAAALIATSFFSEAVELLREVSRQRPADHLALMNLGHALGQLGQSELAMDAYRRVIALRSDFADAHFRLAQLLDQRSQLEEAIEHAQLAVQSNRSFHEARSFLGLLLARVARFEESLAMFRQVTAAIPNHAAAGSNLLATLNYDPAAAEEAIAAAHREWGVRFAGTAIGPTFANGRDPHRPLRVGYVSADLCSHSVAYFIEPILAGHKDGGPSGPAILAHCYADNRRKDTTTDRLRATAHGWTDASALSDEELGRRIRGDGIDILVELGGHTSGNRLRMLAERVAPIQVSYLGYPNTTGVAAMDFRITDAVADPPNLTEHLHTEKLLRLPDSFLCYRAPQEAVLLPARPPRASDGAVTLGSFNAPMKINAAVVDLWARAMQHLPGSRLLLKGFGMEREIHRRRMRDGFAAGGISPERLEFLPPTATLAEHLATYNRVDIALDTFPYNGTTTTCEALFMGVPVVTRAGNAHRSRVSASILSAVGMPDLIAPTDAVFIDIVTSLANNAASLRELQATLRPRMQASPLLDQAAFTRHLEAAYRTVWHNYCAGAAGG